jgi:hypothetical protein
VAKPNKLLEWNSSGTNRVEPSAGLKSTGYPLEHEPTSGNFNWLLFQIDLWLTWLSNRTQGWIPEPFIATNWSVTINGADAPEIAMRSSGGGSAYIDMARHLMDGDRLTSIGFTMAGDGAADLTVEAIFVPKTGAAPTSLGSTTINNEPAALANKTFNVTDTTIDTTLGQYLLVFTASATGLKVYHWTATVGLPP